MTTEQEKIEGTCKMFDTIAAASGERGEELREKMASSIASGWDTISSEVGDTAMVKMRSSLRFGSWRGIGKYIPMSFKIEHNIPPTNEDLAAGPESGWWYIRSTIFPFSLLPGIPYIHNPVLSRTVTGSPSFPPVCRITTDPFK